MLYKAALKAAIFNVFKAALTMAALTLVTLTNMIAFGKKIIPRPSRNGKTTLMVMAKAHL